MGCNAKCNFIVFISRNNDDTKPQIYSITCKPSPNCCRLMLKQKLHSSKPSAKCCTSHIYKAQQFSIGKRLHHSMYILIELGIIYCKIHMEICLWEWYCRTEILPLSRASP